MPCGSISVPESPSNGTTISRIRTTTATARANSNNPLRRMASWTWRHPWSARKPLGEWVVLYLFFIFSLTETAARLSLSRTLLVRDTGCFPERAEKKTTIRGVIRQFRDNNPRFSLSVCRCKPQQLIRFRSWRTNKQYAPTIRSLETPTWEMQLRYSDARSPFPSADVATWPRNLCISTINMKAYLFEPTKNVARSFCQTESHEHPPLLPVSQPWRAITPSMTHRKVLIGGINGPEILSKKRHSPTRDLSSSASHPSRACDVARATRALLTGDVSRPSSDSTSIVRQVTGCRQ